MEKQLEVRLIACTPNPEITVAAAAHLCYAGVSVGELQKKVDAEYAKKLIKRLVSEGHWSVLEHASFSFAVEGVSRALTHQLVRHRIASYSQQSQRYVNEKEFGFIVPPSVKADKKAHRIFLDSVGESRKAYAQLIEAGIPKEDARFLLPNAAESRIIVTMNASSLFNFFERRCCTRAQWEIRALAQEMLELCRDAAPSIFESAGPICDRLGYCPERESCGRHAPKKDALKGE